MPLKSLVPITLLVGGGCQFVGRNAPAVTPPDAPQTTASLTAHEPDCLWDAIEETLRRQGFRLDRVDRDAGIVTTMPESSQHFFEFWRHDVDTRPDFWEASMNSMRRWAQVQVSPSVDAASQLTVTVYKQRLSTLDRQFNSTGAAYQYFGENLPATTGQPKATSEYDRWVDRGRDPAMESLLLAAILERAGQPRG